MQFDTICLSQKCKSAGRQLFSSEGSESNSHISDRHPNEPINPASSFFQSMKIPNINFDQSRERVLSRLEREYQLSIQLLRRRLEDRYQESQILINKVYSFENKSLDAQQAAANLKQKTDHSQIFLKIVNWRHDHKDQNIMEYMRAMPASITKEYGLFAKKVNDSILGHAGRGEDRRLHRGNPKNQEKLEESDQQEDYNKILMEIPKEILQNYMIRNSQIPLKTQLMRSKSIDSKKRTKTHRPDIIQQLAISFAHAKQALKFQDLSPSLQQKLASLPSKGRKTDKFRQFIYRVIRKTCKSIENEVQRQFDLRRMHHSDRTRVQTDLKNYLNWMENDQILIFNKCIKFYHDVDTTIQISPYELYVIYVHIMIKLNQKLKAKKRPITYNASPRKLKKELLYLVFHYQNFGRVKELMKLRYPSDRQLTDDYLDKAYKILLNDAYINLKEKEGIEDKQFEKILQQEKQYGSDTWASITQIFMEYMIRGKLHQPDRLKEIISVLVQCKKPLFERVSLPNPSISIPSKTIDLQSTERLFGRKIEEDCIIHIQDNSNQHYLPPIRRNLFFEQDRLERKRRVINATKVIKIEDVSDSRQSSESEQDEKIDN